MATNNLIKEKLTPEQLIELENEFANGDMYNPAVNPYSFQQTLPIGKVDIGGLENRLKLGLGDLNTKLEISNMQKMDSQNINPTQSLSTLLQMGYGQDIGNSRVQGNISKPLSMRDFYTAQLMGMIPVNGGTMNLGVGGTHTTGENRLNALMGGYNQPLNGGMLNFGINKPKGMGNEYSVNYRMPLQ